MRCGASLLAIGLALLAGCGGGDDGRGLGGAPDVRGMPEDAALRVLQKAGWEWEICGMRMPQTFGTPGTEKEPVTSERRIGDRVVALGDQDCLEWSGIDEPARAAQPTP